MIYDLNNYEYSGLKVPMELWRPITQEMVPNVKPIYWISNLGNIYNAETKAYFNQTIVENRYINVTLHTTDNKKVNVLIHRLVCMAFNGMPPSPDKYQVDHLNCNKTCNFESNLEWVTPKENTERAMNNGLTKVGEDSYKSIFTNEEVIEICGMLMRQIPIEDICTIMESKIYPRTYSNIRKHIFRILNKEIWKSITKNYNFPSYTNTIFSDNEVEIICKYLEDGISFDDILIAINRYDKNSEDENKRLRAIISSIKNGFTYSHISSKYKIQKGRKYILTDNEINYICESVVKGIRPKYIIESMGERGLIPSIKQSVYNISAGLIHKDKLEYYRSLLTEGSTTIP